MAKIPVTIQDATSEYTFSFPISNSPEFPDIQRVLCFDQHPMYKLSGARKEVQSRFDILHYNGGNYNLDMTRPITLYSDGEGGVTYPKGLDIVNGDVICDDYTMLNDIEFFENWVISGKSMPRLFELIVYIHDQKVFDWAGIPAIGNAAKLSFFDCKYYGLCK